MCAYMTQVMPGGLSPDAYVDKRLRPLDSEHYSAAGILPYRRRADSVELMLPRERPWNSFSQSYDPISWNIFGGKRVPRMERSPEVTAVRSFFECLGEVAGVPTEEEIYSWLSRSFIVWYPVGKFALLVFEVPDDKLSDFIEKYADYKKVSGDEEFRILPQGIKKWSKQIDALEWVPTSSLLPEASSEVSDLLANILQVPRFKEFLEGAFDPAKTWPQLNYEPPRPQTGKGKGKSNGKDFRGKGGGMKGYGQFVGRGMDMGMSMGMGMTLGMGQGYGMGGMAGMGGMGVMGMGAEISFSKGSYGKGLPPDYGKGTGVGPFAKSGKGMEPAMQMPMYNGGKAMQMPQMAYPQPVQPNSEELQRQMYGEQLYIMVQPLSPSPYLAQKITGMLLELPQNELVLNLTDTEELHRRVREAMEVLREDGVVG